MEVFRRVMATLVAGALLAPTMGCTLLGAGIGAAVPRASDEEIVAPIQAVPRGSEVTVVYFRPVDGRGGGHMQIDGMYRGTDDGRAVIERGDKFYMIPISRIEETRAHPPTSNYATEGALIGGAVDVTLVVLSVWLFSNAFSNTGGAY